MAKHWENTVRELKSAGIIDDDTAARIEVYYNNKENMLSGRQLLVFGILGAVLVGLGLILIIAHNWDNLARPVKAFFAFVPLIAGQAACAWALYRHKHHAVWKESASVFLFFAVGASMALISQIYHLPGDLGGFVLTWMLLCLPQIYLLRSSGTSLLFITGITFYACETGYWSQNNEIPWLYLALLVAVMPYYTGMFKKGRVQSNFAAMHHWFVPFSVVITLGAFAGTADQLVFIAYVALFSLLFLVGRYLINTSQNSFLNSYQAIGSLGIIALLLVFSFQGNWRFIENFSVSFGELLGTNIFRIIVILTLAVAVIIIRQVQRLEWMDFNITAYAVFVYILSFYLATYDPLNAVILINLFLFFQGVLIVRQGLTLNHLGILNYGLFIISALIVCRFFDMQLSFILRGIIFLIVGISFFILNYRIIERKKLK